MAGKRLLHTGWNTNPDDRYFKSREERTKLDVADIDDRMRKLFFVKEKLAGNSASLAEQIRAYQIQNGITLTPSVYDLNRKYKQLARLTEVKRNADKELARVELQIMLLGQKKKKLVGTE
jgi:hypothetical protein